MRKDKQFLAILILLFVGLLFWVLVSLITSQTSEKISPELNQLAAPLTPVIDTSTLDLIEEKRVYSPQELSQFTIYKILTTRDGRSQRIVPLEVTIEDLEPQEEREAAEPTTTRSLLQQLDEEEESQQEEDEGSEFQIPESELNGPSPSPESAQTGLGAQL